MQITVERTSEHSSRDPVVRRTRDPDTPREVSARPQWFFSAAFSQLLENEQAEAKRQEERMLDLMAALKRMADCD